LLPATEFLSAATNETAAQGYKSSQVQCHMRGTPAHAPDFNDVFLPPCR
jgi:hypothetical protein